MFVFAQWQISGMLVVANVHPMAGFLFGFSGECSSHQTAGFWGSLQLVCYDLNCRAFFGFSAANDYLSNGHRHSVQVH